MTKTFLTCAVTGNITQPSMTPHLPVTPEHIARDCLEAAEKRNLRNRPLQRSHKNRLRLLCQ